MPRGIFLALLAKIDLVRDGEKGVGNMPKTLVWILCAFGIQKQPALDAGCLTYTLSGSKIKRGSASQDAA